MHRVIVLLWGPYEAIKRAGTMGTGNTPGSTPRSGTPITAAATASNSNHGGILGLPALSPIASSLPDPGSEDTRQKGGWDLSPSRLRRNRRPDEGP